MTTLIKTLSGDSGELFITVDNRHIVAFEKSDSSCLYKEWEEMWLRRF